MQMVNCAMVLGDSRVSLTGKECCVCVRVLILWEVLTSLICAQYSHSFSGCVVSWLHSFWLPGMPIVCSKWFPLECSVCLCLQLYMQDLQLC